MWIEANEISASVPDASIHIDLYRDVYIDISMWGLCLLFALFISSRLQASGRSLEVEVLSFFPSFFLISLFFLCFLSLQLLSLCLSISLDLSWPSLHWPLFFHLLSISISLSLCVFLCRTILWIFSSLISVHILITSQTSWTSSPGQFRSYLKKVKKEEVNFTVSLLLFLSRVWEPEGRTTMKCFVEKSDATSSSPQEDCWDREIKEDSDW